MYDYSFAVLVGMHQRHCDMRVPEVQRVDDAFERDLLGEVVDRKGMVSECETRPDYAKRQKRAGQNPISSA
jgi:hypothetical protein